ncbi:MAG TPA: UDP-N-acetylmuramoyl-L-alanine--D-glutamate ligase [Thermoanaerobaculia bacterium]|nr:UDP-N-acetylmuramoyl-L-alanine--D-glutamate ligase [Thermoanaerobaculia bacterium]
MSAPGTADLGGGRHWRRVLVYGVGTSGRAAARLLLDRGAAVVGVDGRDPDALDLGPLAVEPRFELVGEDAPLPRGLDGVVLSPGVPPERPLLAAAREAGLPLISEVELAFPLLAGPVVGVTGTNGKSTTTALAGAMIEAAGHAVEVCGNIGDAVSSRVDGPPGRVFVIELSSYQLEAMESFRPNAAAWLNLTPDHLDRYAGLDAYAAAKESIFARQRTGDVAVLNADDPRTAAAVSRGRRRFFSRLARVADGCLLAGDEIVEVEPGGAETVLFRRGDLPLAGAHNVENAMAAALLARALGAEPEDLRRALAGFRALPHRMERVAEAGGVGWWDDSKATNFAATAKSLADLPDGTVHLILGGRGKGDDPSQVVALAAAKAKRLYLVGEAADHFASVFADAAPIERSGTLDRAVASAAAAARPGDAVLLSPACASFDQFRSFAHRGDVFQQLVHAALADGGGEG